MADVLRRRPLLQPVALEPLREADVLAGAPEPLRLNLKTVGLGPLREADVPAGASPVYTPVFVQLAKLRLR